MKAKDIFISRDGKVRGYCSCGREVQKNKDSECPYCRKPIEWEDDEEE